MAFTRKALEALKLEGNVIDTLIEMHQESLAPIKEARDEALKAQNDENGTPWKQKAEALAKKLKEAQESTLDKDGKSWKDKYDELVQKQETDKVNAQKEAAVRKWLKDNGVTRDKLSDLLMGKVDLAAVTMDGDKIKDDSNLKSLKTAYAECFATQKEKGTNTITPPSGGSGSAYTTKEQIMAISDRTERRNQIAAHPDLFGIELTKE